MGSYEVLAQCLGGSLIECNTIPSDKLDSKTEAQTTASVFRISTPNQYIDNIAESLVTDEEPRVTRYYAVLIIQNSVLLVKSQEPTGMGWEISRIKYKSKDMTFEEAAAREVGAAGVISEKLMTIVTDKHISHYFEFHVTEDNVPELYKKGVLFNFTEALTSLGDPHMKICLVLSSLALRNQMEICKSTPVLPLHDATAFIITAPLPNFEYASKILAVNRNESRRTLCFAVSTRSGEVLLITSRKHLVRPGLLLPKGNFEIVKDKSLEAGAAREAFEEGGVRGEIKAKLMSVVTKRYFSHYFELDVSCEYQEWPEMECRNRHWLSYDAALEGMVDLHSKISLTLSSLAVRDQEVNKEGSESLVNETRGLQLTQKVFSELSFADCGSNMTSEDEETPEINILNISQGRNDTEHEEFSPEVHISNLGNPFSLRLR